MLATPYIPPPLPPSHHESDQRNNNPTNDPFHALYYSLANLTLTTRETTTDPPSSSSFPTVPAQTVTGPEEVIQVTPLFPSGDNVVFAHSSFFSRHHRRAPHGLPAPYWQQQQPDLPSPVQVRERAAAAHLGPLLSTYHGGSHAQQQQQQEEGGRKEEEKGKEEVLVPFPEFPVRLMVKYHYHRVGRNGNSSSSSNGNWNWNGNGSQAASSEGKAMMLVRSVVTGSEAAVVVPEVFGWRRDAGSGDGFVYMAMPEGDVLADRWEGMGEMERGQVCAQLRGVVSEWRRLRLGGVGFVGSVDNGPLGDLIFQRCTAAGAPPPGPFPTVAAFHDYFVTMAVSISQDKYGGAGGSGQIRYTPHHLFPDDVPVLFTHGALHPRNIIVSAGQSPRLVSIIGWEQAGWYPAYWELCKARLECSRHGGLGSWETKYLPWILDVEGLSRETRGWQVGSLCQYWDYFVGLM
ncbi:uncharacterized protein B0T15DRAFT_232028 [Chaetomium strumarium]|uniref:Aminoglycoside phosphotransferase domain-containing protein n=1 Tax=Chaetomium strumarium TaxID=1170767 RepID=A0AAJ0GQ90_9PEZI|nr:hypothetical protein B0T15DRAFT_232028 [Chaetomium strumarium]